VRIADDRVLADRQAAGAPTKGGSVVVDVAWRDDRTVTVVAVPVGTGGTLAPFTFGS
jgi:co-chaperonin GroES (HSP10)